MINKSLFKSNFPEIYFLGSDLRRCETCQFGLNIKIKTKMGWLFFFYLGNHVSWIQRVNLSINKHFYPSPSELLENPR